MDVALWLSVSLVGYIAMGKLGCVIQKKFDPETSWDPDNASDRQEAMMTLLLWPLLYLFGTGWLIIKVFALAGEGIGNFAVGGKRDPAKKKIEKKTNLAKALDDATRDEDSSWRW